MRELRVPGGEGEEGGSDLMVGVVDGGGLPVLVAGHSLSFVSFRIWLLGSLSFLFPTSSE